MRVAGAQISRFWPSARWAAVALPAGAAVCIALLTEVILRGCQFVRCLTYGAWMCGRTPRRAMSLSRGGAHGLYRTHIWSSRGP